ncbi:protein kinase [Pseudonocardia sp. DSM 110487]|nr:protein kinase [Pseudonocardia sp. DSM 110487]
MGGPLNADAVAEGHAVLGPYRLEGLLGRGGMGEVYRAFDTRRGRAVALKVLPPALAGDDNFRARFRRESDSAARLQDPHVIPIHDFGEIEGRLYIDMRLVDGVGLDQIIASGPLEPRRAVALIAQVAEALTDAHAHGVQHRDVKPSNILVTRSDFVYLVDFGIARAVDGDVTALTQSGATIGTLAYMAPERFEGGPPDSRSDIYSLACTLAECLTGRRPFAATSLPSLMKAHLSAAPPRPSLERRDVPAAMDEVIARGMAKDPAARYPTARDLAAAAQYALHQWGLPSAPVPTGPARPAATLVQATPTPPRRSRVLGLVASILAVAAGSGVIGFALGHSAGSAQAQVAASSGPASTDSASLPTTTSPAAGSITPRVTAAPVVPAPSGGSRPATYVYTVESNYPVMIIYTDSKGDQVTLSSVDAPWTVNVSTTVWGADARPMLTAGSTSSKGDTTVSCTIADDQGRVLATNSSATAYASTSCLVFR